MFEETLKTSLKRIFQVKKVSYDLPGESKEQECLFIEIQSSKNSIKKNIECATVRGTISMFANNEKLPFGFFSKKINSADPSLTKDLYFYNIDENVKTIQNIVERRCNFVYLYTGEYDPEGGSLTSVDFE